MALSLIAVAFGVTQAEGEREITRRYLDVVFAVAREGEATAGGLIAMIESIEEYTRPQLAQALGEMEEIGDSTFERLIAAEPPRSLVAAHEALKIAVSAWRSGLSETREGLLALSANPVDEDGLRVLSRGVLDLRVGDRAYRGFLSGMTGVDTEMHGGPLPSIAFVPPDRDEWFDPTALAKRLLASPDLQVVSDLAVADLRLQPPPLGSQRGLPVVPATQAHFAEATIVNVGNIEQLDVRVTLQLLSETGALHEDEFVIPELAAREATTAVFTELPLAPGTTYELTVRVPGDDDDPENDSQTITFMVNPDS